MTRPVLALLALTAALAAPPARAALECQYYDQMVAQAVMIMQIEKTTVTPPSATDSRNRCTVQGTIVRSFLGPHPVGTLIETVIPCIGYPLPPGTDDDIEIGATVFKDFDALRDAAVIELHIAPEGGPAGYGAGARLLDAATDAPTYTSFCN